MNPVWHFLNGVPHVGRAAIATNLAGDGSASAPSYSFLNETDLGLFRFGAATVGMGKNTAMFLFNGATGAFTIGADSGSITLGGLADITLSRGAADVWTTPDRFVSTGPTAGIGYATGAGGAQTQLTSKATTVVSNTVTGEITMHNATLNAATAVTFALTNSGVATGDYVLVQHVSAGTLGAYVCQAVAGSGTANITVTNRTAGNLGEAIVLKYMVFKSATS